MNKGKAIIISKPQGLMYIMIGFVILLGIIVFSTVDFRNIISRIMDFPVILGLTALILIGLFFILPLALLLFLKNIEIYNSCIIINYKFRLERKIIDLKDIDSIETYEGDVRGYDFKEMCIKLKNRKEIKFNSLSNKDFDKFTLIISRLIKDK